MTGEDRRPATGLSDEYFAALVKSAPPLTPEQAAQLAEILAPINVRAVA